MYETVELAQFLGTSWCVGHNNLRDTILLDVFNHLRVHCLVTVEEDLITFDTDDFLRIFIHKILIPFFTDTFCEEHADAVLWCDGLFQVVFSEHNFFI